MFVSVFDSLVMYIPLCVSLLFLNSIIIFLDKNILVHQSCPCKTPLQCSCIGGSGVTYVLGDMGLFWMEKNLTKKYMEWATAKDIEPAGTKGMKAPEVKYVSCQVAIPFTLSNKYNLPKWILTCS